jgi:hypothetical protein
MSTLSIDPAKRLSLPSPNGRGGCTAEVGRTLDLSESRTHDAAMEALHAYKLSGNFPINLETVLHALHVSAELSFDVKPKRLFSDCRKVEFMPKGRLDTDRFDRELRHIAHEIGVAATPTFWARLFRRNRVSS